MDGGLGLCRADQQSADRVAFVERIEQPTDLVTIPDVASLELEQGHGAAVDLIEEGGDLHDSS
jgi:hypothetical protein